MSDVELTIKIPKTLKDIADEDDIKTFSHIIWQYILVVAIKNGTPLPKGHGRLIDVGQCDRKLFYQQCGGADSLITAKSAFDMLMALPTIIEADRAESEEV